MESSKLFWVLAILALEMLALSGLGMGDSVSNKCEFQAVYNFGDSNSDTGGISAALSQVTSPNGETFFGHPAGRFCDGRLIIDFFAQQLKLPYLSPYLDSIGTNFSHGANFATGGSSIRPGGYSPFHLGIQVSQFIQFKARTAALYNKLPSLGGGKWPPFKANLPRPEDFSRALYTFDIGQNDLAYGFQTTTEQQTLISIPDILNQFSQAIHRLYKEGARIFWVHNTGPIGCLPYNVIYNAKPGNIDENGCAKSQNQVAQEFNYQLKNMISKLRTELPGSRLTYVDVYSAKYQLIATATRQGFEDPMKFCCGSYYGYHINCGKKAKVNGTVYGNPCKSPDKHISWDGIHYSQAANQWVALKILTGSLSHPPLSLDEACHTST